MEPQIPTAATLPDSSVASEQPMGGTTCGVITGYEEAEPKVIVPHLLLATPPRSMLEDGGSSPTDARQDKEQGGSNLDLERHSLTAPLDATLRPLPSLLQYVDHDLMKFAAVHNHPPYPQATCPVCFFQWDIPYVHLGNDGHKNTIEKHLPVRSTFLPLSPCGHWLHYRCLIWVACQNSEHKDKCFFCNIQLFEWDGISVLTLATRTNLEVQDEMDAGNFDLTMSVQIVSDKAEYESQCQFIDTLISCRFLSQLFVPSKYADHSPDLMQCYHGVLDELKHLKRPRAKWLTWRTQTGSHLFRALVAIKMRRFLVQEQGKIMKTQGWKEFEDGCKSLQDKILKEVHRS